MVLFWLFFFKPETFKCHVFKTNEMISGTLHITVFLCSILIIDCPYTFLIIWILSTVVIDTLDITVKKRKVPKCVGSVISFLFYTRNPFYILKSWKLAEYLNISSSLKPHFLYSIFLLHRMTRLLSEWGAYVEKQGCEKMKGLVKQIPSRSRRSDCLLLMCLQKYYFP